MALDRWEKQGVVAGIAGIVLMSVLIGINHDVLPDLPDSAEYTIFGLGLLGIMKGFSELVVPKDSLND